MSVEAEADSGEGCLPGLGVIFSLYPLVVKRDSRPSGLLLQGLPNPTQKGSRLTTNYFPEVNYFGTPS